jgi:hypothetical protein
VRHAILLPVAAGLQISIRGDEPRRSWRTILTTFLDKPDVAAASAFFGGVFGDDGVASDSPLAKAYHTAFQTGRPQCVRLHGMIMALEGTPNRDSLVRELGLPRWKDYVAAVIALEFCSRFRTSGCDVELIKADGKAPRPDARVMPAGRWLTVEFKGLHDPHEKAPWDDLTDDVLCELMMEHGIDNPRFEIHFAPPALGNPAEVVRGLLDIQARAVREFEALPSETGWARISADGATSFSLPLAEKDDVTKIARNLADAERPWTRQLGSVTGATVLVVKSQDIFRSLDRHEVLARVDELSRQITNPLLSCPEIGAILIYEELLLSPPPGFVATTGSARVVLGSSEGFTRGAVLLQNRAARVALLEQEIDALIGERMRW